MMLAVALVSLSSLLLELALLLLDLVDEPKRCGHCASKGVVYLLQACKDGRNIESEL